MGITTGSRFLVYVFSAVLVGIYLLIAALFGLLFAGAAFHDPDSCFLFALGRYIFEHRTLPAYDPFSYTFSQLNCPYVAYQWLTALSFFLTYKLFGLGGTLMIFAGVIEAIFAGLPLLLAKKFKNIRRIWLPAIIAGILLVPSASAHALMRPEIFSYLFLSLWMVLITFWRLNLLKYENSTTTSNVDLSYTKLAASFIILMVFWVNFHSGFVLGLILLALLTVAHAFETINWPYAVKSRFLSKRNLLFLIPATIACLAISLVNPYCTKLWLYLPHLFFSPINAYIQELKPISLTMAVLPFYIPFFCLCLLALLRLAQAFRLMMSNKPVPGILFSLIVIALSLVSAVQVLRMVPFAAIVLAYEFIFLSCLIGDWSATQQTKNRFLDNLNEGLSEVFEPATYRWIVKLILVTLLASYIAVSRIQPPKLPQSNAGFNDPVQATLFLKTHKIAGNLFNDAQYGDVLIWKIPLNPKVFIDTRYDMYGDRFVQDYMQMSFCQRSCDDLFERYRITCAFIPAGCPLAKHLQAKNNWKSLYSDPVAVILEKP